MFISQISVFAENRPGAMLEITGVLAKNNIDIRAHSLADTTQFGILRLIVDDPQRACKLLQEAKFAVSITKVLAIAVSDTPGGLHGLLEQLHQYQINIDYAYAFMTRNVRDAVVILRVEDLERAADILSKADVRLLGPEQVYEM